MKLQERGGGRARTFGNLPRARSLGDTEQEAEHEIAHEQAAEVVGKFGRPAVEQTARLSLSHHRPQRGATGFPTY